VCVWLCGGVLEAVERREERSVFDTVGERIADCGLRRIERIEDRGSRLNYVRQAARPLVQVHAVEQDKATVGNVVLPAVFKAPIRNGALANNSLSVV